MLDNLQNNICEIIKHYQKSFKDKIQPDDNQATDILMDLFNIIYETKATNKQFWGRELGMLWQKIVTEVFKDKEEIFVRYFPMKPVAKPAFLLLGFGTYDQTTRGWLSRCEKTRNCRRTDL